VYEYLCEMWLESLFLAAIIRVYGFTAAVLGPKTASPFVLDIGMISGVDRVPPKG